MALKNTAVFILFTGSLLGCKQQTQPTSVPARSTSVESAKEIALQLVKKYHVADNLKPIAAKMAWATQTAKMITGDKLQQSLTNVEPKFRPAWERALANCYATHLTQSDLASILQSGKTSEAYPKFIRVQKPVSECMHLSASNIPQQMAVDALTSAYK